MADLPSYQKHWTIRNIDSKEEVRELAEESRMNGGAA
jgi:hypothetical protein